MIQILLAGLSKGGKQVAYALGERQAKTDFPGYFEHGVEILQLVSNGATGHKVAVDHALAMLLQNPALTEAAQDCFPNLSRIRPAGFGQEQAFPRKAM
jgi:hypothetical protein